MPAGSYRVCLVRMQFRLVGFLKYPCNPLAAFVFGKMRCILSISIFPLVLSSAPDIIFRECCFARTTASTIITNSSFQLLRKYHSMPFTSFTFPLLKTLDTCCSSIIYFVFYELFFSRGIITISRTKDAVTSLSMFGSIPIDSVKAGMTS